MVEIYVLRDPIDGTVRYVGSSVNAAKRAVSHWASPNRDKQDWLLALHARGLKPVVEVLLTVHEDDAEREETRCMEVLARWGAPLYNVQRRGYRARWRSSKRERGLRPWQQTP